MITQARWESLQTVICATGLHVRVTRTFGPTGRPIDRPIDRSDDQPTTWPTINLIDRFVSIPRCLFLAIFFSNNYLSVDRLSRYLLCYFTSEVSIREITLFVFFFFFTVEKTRVKFVILFSRNVSLSCFSSPVNFWTKYHGCVICGWK